MKSMLWVSPALLCVVRIKPPRLLLGTETLVMTPSTIKYSCLSGSSEFVLATSQPCSVDAT